MMTFNQIGKRRRLDRLFTNGKTVVTPIDDSLIFGAKEGLYDLDNTIKEIAKGFPSAVLGYKRDIELLTETNIKIPFIYNLTASTVLSTHTRKTVVAGVENALAAGADCVAAHINFTSKYETEMLYNFAEIANECDRFGMPLLAIAYPRKEVEGKDDNYDELRKNNIDAYSDLVAHATRVATELGADIIKTQYTGSEKSFEKVVCAALGKPVLIAGGPKILVEKSLANVASAMRAGAAGISYGRNVFNAENIAAYIRAIKQIVFENKTLEEALKSYYNDNKS